MKVSELIKQLETINHLNDVDRKKAARAATGVILAGIHCTCGDDMDKIKKALNIDIKEPSAENQAQLDALETKLLGRDDCDGKEDKELDAQDLKMERDFIFDDDATANFPSEDEIFRKEMDR